MNDLFFELVRVSIGTQDGLTRIPTEAEWDELLHIAEKHSLIGICFVGLQNMGADADDGFERIGMSEDQYLEWMGLAAQIQNKNEIVDGQCVELQAMLRHEGFRSCLLKGQGNAALYGELDSLRQSGDIDMWVEGGFEKVMSMVNRISPSRDFTFQHVHFDCFDDTEVEIHYVPIVIMGYSRNARLQKWLSSQLEACFQNKMVISSACQSICVPTAKFNLVYQLAHIYRHLFMEGVGLRQLLDYWYLLKYSVDNGGEDVFAETREVIGTCGMLKFAKAMVWSMDKVFGGDVASSLGIEPDPREGRYLLEEIMQMGNFGKYDTRYEVPTGSKWSVMKHLLQSKTHLLFHYPTEVLSTPFYLMRHFVWKHVVNRKWLN